MLVLFLQGGVLVVALVGVLAGLVLLCQPLAKVVVNGAVAVDVVVGGSSMNENENDVPVTLVCHVDPVMRSEEGVPVVGSVVEVVQCCSVVFEAKVQVEVVSFAVDRVLVVIVESVVGGSSLIGVDVVVLK